MYTSNKDKKLNVLKTFTAPPSLHLLGRRKKAAFTLAEVFSPSRKVERKVAFTLAETLITLGIIGVVAAMTLPVLIGNYNKKVTVTRLHQTVNLIQQASLMYITNNGGLNLVESGLTSASAMSDFLNNYLKVVKDCSDDRRQCFASVYKSLNGNLNVSASWWNAAGCAVLANGVSVMIDRPNCYKVTVDDVTSYYGHMLIDINGLKGPNESGKDLFYLEFYEDGSIDGRYVTPACRQKGICLDGLSPRERRDYNYYNTVSNYGNYFDKILNDNWEITY